MWSWVLTGVGLVGFYLSGKKLWVGWAINLANQVVWLAYALVTRQFGFLPGVVLYGLLYARNMRAWRADARA